jgi:hypothetical protein
VRVKSDRSIAPGSLQGSSNRAGGRAGGRASIMVLLDLSLVKCLEALEEEAPSQSFEGINEDLERFQQDDTVKQALQSGVDLRFLARDIEEELREVEADSVREYVNQSSQVLLLHQRIQSCDGILARMQEMLLGFQADLGGISDEIKHLQEESISMNIKLKNRRAAEEMLSGFLDRVVVPPELATAICGDDVNDAYLEYMIALNSKVSYVGLDADPDGSSLGLAPCETRAAKELTSHLLKLRDRASAKAQEYILAKIAELRKPKTNVQIIQKNSLLKYQYLMHFVAECDPEVAEEIRGTYMESMGRTIYNLFKAYHGQLAKLEVELANRNDLIAVEEASVKSIFSSKVDLTKRGDAFCLGGRDKVLESVESSPLLVHVVVAEGTHLPYEAIFRSVLKHLVDSATSECLFSLEFFRGKGTDSFNRIYDKTLTMVSDSLEAHISSSFDAIGLLLMIKLVHAYRLVMQRRRIPVLEPFFDRLNMLLWPRFKHVFDANLKSVSSANPKRMGAVELHPHYMVRRYAEFAASLLALQSGLDSLVVGIGGEDMLLNNLKTLTAEVVKLVQRMSHLLPRKKMQHVFLINNFDQVLTLFQERRIAADDVYTFDTLLAEQRELFVEEELRERFGKLMAFVTSTEEASSTAEVSETALAALVREFAATWKSGLEAIDQHVQSFFTNFRNGKEIRKQVFTQLLLYYQRLQEIIAKKYKRQQPAFAKDIVSTAAILTEIKKYSRNA